MISFIPILWSIVDLHQGFNIQILQVWKFVILFLKKILLFWIYTKIVKISKKFGLHCVKIK
jgi:hypothetical protein